MHFAPEGRARPGRTTGLGDWERIPVVLVGLPMLRWIAFISANIGFLNLLPVPVLDGGHLLFYAIEAVRRRPLSQRMQEIGFQIGIALVLMLMVYVNLNDLLRVWRRLTGAG